MKRYLWIVLFLITNLGFAQPSVDLTKSNTDNNLLIQLMDSKLANIDNKLTAVEQSNKDGIADLKARTDEKLADKFKQLDDKSADVGWWLAFIGIVMAIATFVVAAIQIVSAVGLISLRKEADKLLNQIRDNHEESKELTKKQAEMLANPPPKVNEQNKQDIEKINDILLEKPENQLTAKDWFIRGLNAHEHKEYYEAITYYNSAIKLNPHFAASYNNRGVTKSELKQYKEAIKDYDKAIELDPNDATPYNNRGGAKANLQQYEEAVTDYDKAIELKANDALYYSNRGNAKANLKQCEEAVTDYDKAVELDPNDALYYSYRGLAKAKLRQYDDAIRDHDKAIELAPDNVNVYFNKACAYALLENKNEALNWLGKALQLGYSVEEVQKDEDWKNYSDDQDFKDLIAEYNKQ